MSRLFESDEGPLWLTEEKFLVFKIRGCEKSLTTVTETVDRGKSGTTVRFLAVVVPLLQLGWSVPTKYGKFKLRAT